MSLECELGLCDDTVGGDIGGEPIGVSRGGEDDNGVETSLAVLEPLVAAMDGDEGGSGERVK